LRNRISAVDPERHQRLGPLVVLDVLHLADAHPGDPDVVALLEHRGVAEDRLVRRTRAEADVAHDHRQQAGDQDRDRREDTELDAGGDRGGVAAHRASTCREP
jgi:hypothetical protein